MQAEIELNLGQMFSLHKLSRYCLSSVGLRGSQVGFLWPF